MGMAYRAATQDDIAAVLALHFKNQVDSMAEEDKQDGFITTAFTQQQMQALIRDENGLFVAELDDEIVAYAMAASWQFWSQWPMFAYMVDDLHTVEYQGIQLSVENSYQYGPVCVDKRVRGSGVFEGVFQFALEQMAKRYAVLVTFINKINARSYAAHTQKVGLDVVKEFEYNGNNYYELACLTCAKE